MISLLKDKYITVHELVQNPLKGFIKRLYLLYHVRLNFLRNKNIEKLKYSILDLLCCFWFWGHSTAIQLAPPNLITYYYIWTTFINPLRMTVIQKLLEIIGIVRLCPSCSFATALDSDINQTTGMGGLLSMWENRCMHATVCLLRAGQPRSASDVAKSGQFTGQFSWVTGDPIVLKGLRLIHSILCPVISSSLLWLTSDDNLYLFSITDNIQTLFNIQKFLQVCFETF